MQRIIIALIIVTLLAACGSSSEHVPAEAPLNQTPMGASAAREPMPEVQLVRVDVPRITSPETTDVYIKELVKGLNSFAFGLYHNSASTGAENLIFSPYGISLAFALAYAGAQGETAAQMAEVFGYLPQETQHPTFNALDQRMARLAETTATGIGDPFQLRIANAVWGQQNLTFRDEYLAILAQQYGAGLQVADFALQPELSRETINAWVADQTAKRITDLVPAGGITADTKLALLNAIYFNASWAFPFDAAMTQDGAFTLLDGTTVTAPLMRQQRALVPYTEGEGYQAVRLPYVGETVDMALILPAQGRFDAIAQQLSPDFLSDIGEQAEERSVTLTMPRFTLETDLDLPAQLGAMGLDTPFGAAADFSGMIEKGGLVISKALHRGTITVDETGTEAAAATALVVEDSDPAAAELALDRPFIFAIVERETGTVLFLGHVLNPTS